MSGFVTTLVSRRPLRLPTITIVFLNLLAAGCGMQLRADPPSESAAGIAGQWQLQSPSRAVLADNLRSVMNEARTKQERRDRQEFRRRPDDDINFSTPDADGDGADRPRSAHDLRHPKWEAREQDEQQEALLNALLPNDKLQIVQSANRIELIPQPGARRRFDKAETSTLVTHFASLRIESGWQSNVFVVHSRDSQQGINIVERYQRLGDRLRLQVQFSIPDAKEQSFVADYLLTR
jgi:hypothetical protein